MSEREREREIRGTIITMLQANICLSISFVLLHVSSSQKRQQKANLFNVVLFFC